MSQNLVTLTPLITLLGIFIIIILMISKMAKSRNSYSYQTNKGYKVLCRSQSNRVISGVCGGIAEHFGWNAAIVRLFFVLSGVGILTYIVLSIVIPDSDSPLL